MGRRTDAAAGGGWSSRADRGELLRSVRREDGTWLLEGVAVREGVMTYIAPDGTSFREYVPLQTILDSAAGLGRLPVTLHHPDEDVTPENVRDLGVGDVDGEVVVGDGGFTRVKVAVRRGDAIEAVQGGLVELSPGYQVQTEARSGVHPVYGEYQSVQTARRYNHLAIVDEARGGHEVRLRVDGVSRTTHRADKTRNPSSGGKPKGAPMNQALMGMLLAYGITRRFDDADEAAEALADAKKTADAEAAEKQAAAEAEAETLKADNARLKAENDTLKADKAAAEDKRDHAELSPVATALGLDPAATPKGRDLRKAIAKARLGESFKADATDAHVDAVVDLVRADHSAGRLDGRGAGRAAWEVSHDNSGTARPARPTRRPWGRSPSATNKEA